MQCSTATSVVFSKPCRRPTPPTGWPTSARPETSGGTVGPLLARSAARLAAAGLDSPQSDARLLLAHVLGVTPARLFVLDEVDETAAEAFGRLVEQRARRVPLQHLTGEVWFRHVRLSVGPGVFVPRPETEVMTGWAIDHLRPLLARGVAPRVVELCAGSGAIAKSIVFEAPGVEVHAVEVSEDAGRWAGLNLAGTGVALHLADMATALHELNGTVNLVIANPPYIPLDAYLSVPVEVRDHDPAIALFAGDDGLDAIRVVARAGQRLLRPSGVICVEHADVQGESAPAVFAGSGAYRRIRDHADLAGRPRFVTAVRGEERVDGRRAWQDGPDDH